MSVCTYCPRPATERVVYQGTNFLGNAETVAHAVCDHHVRTHLRTLHEGGWTVLGLTDPDEGSLGRVA